MKLEKENGDEDDDDDGGGGENDEEGCNDDGDKEFWCHFCNLDLKTSKNLIEHNDECHVECDLCREVFKRKFHLKNHMKSNHSNSDRGKINCHHCSKTFPTHMSRWVHTKTVHKNNWKYKCRECDYGTTHSTLFQNHVKKHSEPLDLKCEQCDKEFKSRYRYDVHVKIHEKELSCSVCHKKFDKRKNMLRHVSRNHRSEKKIRDVPCTVCSKMFYDKWTLRVHMEIHSNVKEKCAYCEYETCHPKNLKAHVKNHVKEFDFVCESCGRGFLYNFMLRDHVTKEHGDGLPRLPCETCGKTFATQQYLNVHKQSHEPGYEKRNHQCEICGKKFLTRSMLLRHIRGHNQIVRYVCKYCNKYLSLAPSLSPLPDDKLSLVKKIKSKITDSDKKKVINVMLKSCKKISQVKFTPKCMNRLHKLVKPCGYCTYCFPVDYNVSGEFNNDIYK